VDGYNVDRFSVSDPAEVFNGISVRISKNTKCKQKINSKLKK